MAQLFDIKKVVVGPRKLTATVVVAANAPLRTVEDLEATTRIWQLMPQLRDHVCLGDSSESFGDVMGDTEIAHLLEHVTVELLARTNIAGDITSGQTAEVGERTYEISLTCTDDVLVTGALSSAAWIMQWAFAGGGEPSPDVDAIAGGLVELVASLPEVEGSADAAGDAAVQDGEVAEQVEAPVDGETNAVALADDAQVEVAAEEPQGEELLAAEEASAAENAVEAEAAPVYEFNPQQVEEGVAQPEAFEAASSEPIELAEPAPAPVGAVEAAPAYVAPCDYAPDPAANFVNEPAPAPAAEPQTSTFGDWGMENIPRPRPVR